MWQKFRKREEAIKVYYKDEGEPARNHLPRTAVDGVISWEPVSMHWNIIWSHLETMPCWVWPQVCQRKERSCQDVTIPHPTASDYGHKCVKGRNAAARTLLSHPTPPYPTPPHLETMPCWVWPQVCQRKERSCQDVIIPPHPTPRIWRRCHVECGRKCVRGRNAAARTLLSHTPPHLETMPWWVWPQVCQRKERSCQDVIIPPNPTPPYPAPRIWRRCHVECGCKCVRGRNAASRTLLSHPTPPHLETVPCWVWPQVCQRKESSCQDVIIPPHPTPPHSPASGDDAMLSVAASVSEEGKQLPGRYYPTPPHPPYLESMLCWLWPQLWRGCWFLSRADGGWGMAFFWLRNPLVLVAESPFFGCGIVFFWLRNRLFLVAEAPFFGCGSVSNFGCGIAEIW